MVKNNSLFKVKKNKNTDKTSGVFIVIEGTDGSGKATQTKVLVKRLRREGYRVQTIDYPQYGKKSAGLVEEYLNGRYGMSGSVNPYIHSVFYAADRYDGSFKIRKWLNEGCVVVCDRYTFSNIGHAGAKISDLKKWKEYTRWVCDLEFNFFGIPKPDIVVILKNEAKLANYLSGNVTDKEKLKTKEKYLGKKKQDIHERDKDHLARSIESYERLGRFMPKLCKVVSATKRSEMRTIQEIHDEVWRLVKPQLKK